MPVKKKASKKTKPAVAKKKLGASRSKASPKGTARAKVKAKPKVTAKAKAASKPKAKATAKPKVRATAKPKATRATAAAPKPRFSRRRDATGHLDPRYAAELRAKGLEMHDDDATQQAFLAKARSTDDFAEELGEEAVAEMTSGEDQREKLLDLELGAEVGGPFVETRGRDEFARGTDASNPRSATREPFPKT